MGDVKDPDELARLLATHERDVYGYILSMVLNWVDAEEILQETWVRVYQQFDDWDRSRSFRKWACVIAHYQVLTHRKRSQREKRRLSEGFVDLVAEKQMSEPPIPSAQADALRGCLGSLSKSNRQLLEFFYGGEMNVQAISQQVGRTVPAIYKSVLRLRTSLKQCVQRAMKGRECE